MRRPGRVLKAVAVGLELGLVDGCSTTAQFDRAEGEALWAQARVLEGR